MMPIVLVTAKEIVIEVCKVFDWWLRIETHKCLFPLEDRDKSLAKIYNYNMFNFLMLHYALIAQEIKIIQKRKE